MEEIKPKEGYEIIGSWHISLAIPENVREKIKEGIEDTLQKKADMVYLSFAKRNVYSFDFFESELKKIATDEECEAIFGRYMLCKLTDDDSQLIARALHMISEKGRCQVDQIFVGSTVGVMPDPFFDIGSYCAGEPIDLYERVCRDIEDILKGKVVLPFRSPLKGKDTLRHCNGIHLGGYEYYGIEEIINYKTREARIEPAE